MEFWRTMRSTTVERGRTDAQSVKSQSRKVLICIHTVENMQQHYGINRRRNEMRNYCLFGLCVCGWCASRFSHLHRCAWIRTCASSTWTAWIRNQMANPSLNPCQDGLGHLCIENWSSNRHLLVLRKVLRLARMLCGTFVKAVILWIVSSQS